MLAFLAVIVAGTALWVWPAEEQARVSANVSDWSEAIDLYLDQNCESGLSPQSNSSLTTLPSTFQDYGLTWSFNPVTGLSIVNNAVSNTSLRAVALISSAAHGRNNSGEVEFNHQYQLQQNSFSDVYRYSILSYHGGTESCF